MEDEIFLSEREAAKRAGVARETLRRHRAAGNVPALILKSITLYMVGDLMAWRAQFITGRERGKR